MLCLVVFVKINMRGISKKRKLVEEEGHRHTVKRGFRGKLHFENLPWLLKIFKFFLRVSFMQRAGERNAAEIKLESIEVGFDNLPSGFDNTRILLITDLHIDGMETLAERIVSVASQIDYDFCILGGDYSFSRGPAYSRMREVAGRLVEKSRVFGVLGNYDRYSMAEALNECGVEMLVNESVCLEKGGDKIYLAGLDDCHYYGTDDIGLADSGISDGAFKIMVCHSPERYRQAAKAGYSLHLAGHTHGGQVCLPFGVIVVTGATVPRRLLKGKWSHQTMTGYTSRGVGASGVVVRYFCPPEITIITLRNVRKID